MTKVILVCTSAPELKGHPTGLWLEELAVPYYAFIEAGYDVVIASPAGGPIPLDKNAFGEGFFTDACKKFMHDGEAIGALSHSVKLADLDFTTAGDIDAMYMTGGHGTCVDFVDNPTLAKAIETVYTTPKKVVGVVCHGPTCLVDCVVDGKPLVQGKTVTGFADSEEEAVQLEKLVPFLLETKLKELGANYEKGPDWSSKVCVDGNLVTGQNPQSSEACAAAVIKLLDAK